MVLDLDAFSVDVPRDVWVREIQTDEELATYCSIATDSFGEEPSGSITEMASALRDNSTDVLGFLAGIGDDTAGAARMYTNR